MKKLILISTLTIHIMSVSAQIDTEMSKIGFYPYVIAGKDVSPNVKDLLRSKVEHIILQNSLGDIDNRQFILLAKVDFIDQTVTATVPPIYKVIYNIRLIIADNLFKRKYGAYNINNCIGINANKDRATAQAISRVRSDKLTIAWLDSMKKKIISYYKNNCMLIMIEIDALKEQKRYNKAIEMLSKVPKLTEYCFSMAQEKMIEIFKEKESQECVSELETQAADTSNIKVDILENLDNTVYSKDEDFDWILNLEEVQ